MERKPDYPLIVFALLRLLGKDNLNPSKISDIVGIEERLASYLLSIVSTSQTMASEYGRV